jgi:dTDP-glucose pyrophosphorylase
MRALVLAGGRGKRMEELSGTENKCMLRLGAKRLIEYSLDNAAILDEVDEIIVVVGYRAQSIISVFGDSYRGKPLRYVTQPEQKGLVHAMEFAKSHLERSDFLLFLADEVILGSRHKEMTAHFKQHDLFALCGVFRQPNPEMIKRTYSIIHGPDGSIYRLIEKPRRPHNSLMGTGAMVLKNAILDLIPDVPVNPNRGEKELPDLIQCAVDLGEKVRFFDVAERYINVNTLEELKMAEAQVFLGMTGGR